jgi:predicted HicB family RNase H-like nuclease
MQHRAYSAHVNYDRHASRYYGEVAGIRDVVTFQAKTLDDLEAAFRESVDDYLAYCASRGEEPNQPSIRNAGG